MKTKTDDGPTRKISRSRKRNSSSHYESGLAKKQSATYMKQETKGEKSQETGIWNFKNSFCSENKTNPQTTCTSNIVEHNRRWADPVTQTSATKSDFSDSGMLDTSDALLANIDIDLFDDTRQGNQIKDSPVKNRTTHSVVSNIERRENDDMLHDWSHDNTVPESPARLSGSYLLTRKTTNSRRDACQSEQQTSKITNSRRDACQTEQQTSKTTNSRRVACQTEQQTSKTTNSRRDACQTEQQTSKTTNSRRDACQTEQQTSKTTNSRRDACQTEQQTSKTTNSRRDACQTEQQTSKTTNSRRDACQTEQQTSKTTNSRRDACQTEQQTSKTTNSRRDACQTEQQTSKTTNSRRDACQTEQQTSKTTNSRTELCQTDQLTSKESENLDMDSSFCFDAWDSPIGQSKSAIHRSKRKLRNTSQCKDNDIHLESKSNKDCFAMTKSSESCVNISVCNEKQFCRTSTPKKPVGHIHCDNVGHVNSVNDKMKSELVMQNDFNEDSTKTPKSLNTLGFSLKDKFKKQMQKNASVETPTRGILGQLHQEMLSRARDEAARFEPKGTDVDIGPFYGLPSKVQTLLETQRGITKLYDWQEECLQIPAVLEGKNLIYSLPTSGGKTLVAEILILRELLCKKKDVILVLPFVSIVQEKVRNLSLFAVELNFLVEEYAASKGRFPPIRHRKCSSLYIATIEKAHSLINSFIELKRMDSLGLVVVDELHMIGEGGSRGATLEAMLLKTLHCGTCQIVGMTATLNNAKDLQDFMHADVYSNDFRPVKLTECVKVEENIYTVNDKALCPDDKLQHERVVMFPYSSEIKKQDPDHLLGLVLEVIPDYSCLVFCATKKNCENVALMLCRLMNKYNKKLTDVKKTERRALLKELYKDGEGQICSVLEYTVRFGLAYHHSGLTMDERRLIEDAYSEGTLCLLTCTSTLAAGVNLPAKRVILRSPYVATEFIGHNQYKQMTGRAGRAGIDSSGESILIANKCDKDKLLNLLMGPYDMCHSSLMYEEGKGIRKLLLSAIGLQIVTSTDGVFTLMEKTLLAVQSKTLQHDVALVTKNALQHLIDLKLVIQRKQTLSQDGSAEFCLEVTPLGKATFKGSVDIDNSPQLYLDLKKAEESLVLASHLHLLFLVTPYDLANSIKTSLPWMVYFKQMSTLTPVELKVASLIGVPESYIARKASGQTSRQKVDEFVVSRFFLTLILYDLWQQKSIWDVSTRFQYPRGFVQNLLSAAASFASCVFHFCQELEEFWAFQDLLGNFVKRLTYCVSMELLPLVEIPGVKLGRARQLYSANLRTLQSVASADPESLVKNIEHMPRKSARQIVASAKVLLKEKTDALLEEVEDLVTVPDGNT